MENQKMANPKEAQLESSLTRTEAGIVFKGYRSGLSLVIPENGSFELFLQELEEHLLKAHSFFKNAKVSVQTGRRILTGEEQAKLTQILQEYGLLPQQGADPAEPATSRKFKNLAKPEKIGKAAKTDFGDTITIKRTVRSGQKVQFEGNLLIIGDVNPGAEVVAGGDIVVLGKLRGIAHAGANGDETAQIFALQLNPVQIRIAGIFTRDSDRTKGFKIKNKDFSPEVARIKDNLIVVEHYQ
jgi:septum site-determining protein MinC